jgi:hypothetical protein
MKLENKNLKASVDAAIVELLLRKLVLYLPNKFNLKFFYRVLSFLRLPKSSWLLLLQALETHCNLKWKMSKGVIWVSWNSSIKRMMKHGEQVEVPRPMNLFLQPNQKEKVKRWNFHQ